jgi:hypothetical protein
MTDLANMLENSNIGANIKGHLARLYQRLLIDPKKPNKEVFLKIYIGMQYPVKKIFGLQFFYVWVKTGLRFVPYPFFYFNDGFSKHARK